ncbi:MAG TPA: lysozyme inhibitor LprI family protein [Phenylobacterium sp.]
MKRSHVAVLAGALLAALAAGAHSADWSDEADYADDYPASQALCRQVKHLAIPAADRPTPAEAEGLKGCDSEALYFGIGRAADPVAARKCAILELERPADQPGGYFEGAVVLQMVYANGNGATKNPRLAMHLACTQEDAPAEIDGRVTHLTQLTPGETFEWCDDITSSLAMGACSAHDARIAGANREAALAKLMARWSPAQRAAFAPLRAASEAFVEARSDHEVDMSGSLRATLAIGEENLRRDAFLNLVTALEEGRGPSESPGQYAKADAELNAVYRKVVAAGGNTPLGWGTVSVDDVRAAQRVWLRYRDAWLAFRKVRYPKVSQDALAAELTRERTQMLKAFLDS